jgi:hypothetical protein
MVSKAQFLFIPVYCRTRGLLFLRYVHYDLKNITDDFLMSKVLDFSVCLFLEQRGIKIKMINLFLYN